MDAKFTQDQNGALELELADLKTQLDADVAEARQAQDVLAAKARLEVRTDANVSLYIRIHGLKRAPCASKSHFPVFNQMKNGAVPPGPRALLECPLLCFNFCVLCTVHFGCSCGF